MTILLRLIRILWKIGLIGLLGLFFDHAIFMMIAPLGALVLLDPTLYQSFAQIFGGLYHAVVHGKRIPSKENYTCQNSYVLPFAGKWTVFNGGVDKETSHSWDIVSQRYAYDFIVLDDDGKSFKGDNKSVQSYYCYDLDVLSPADGKVVKVSRRHKDSRVTGAKVFCDTWDIRGNYIIIQHANNEFSFFAHLAPNSITVKVDDKVKQGDVIAKCGNTGNTSEPHLHFQLQTGKSFFFSQTLPITFNGIKAQNKANYELADKRTTEGNLQQAENGVYIGRGLEVYNESEE